MNGLGCAAQYSYRLLMLTPDASSDAGEQQINIVRHWSEELKARVPTEQRAHPKHPSRMFR